MIVNFRKNNNCFNAQNISTRIKMKHVPAHIFWSKLTVEVKNMCCLWIVPATIMLMKLHSGKRRKQRIKHT